MSHYFLTSSISQLITVKFWAEFIAWFHFCRRLKRIIFVFFAKWKKNEFRAMIKHLHMKSLTPKEIKSSWIMFIAYLYQRLRLYTIMMNEFKRGRTATCDAPSSGCPGQKSSIKSTILFWLIESARACWGISHGRVISILHKQLGMKKLSSRWVPRLLIVYHKRDRVTISKQCLEMF